MAEDGRAVGLHVVEEPVAVGVPHVGPLAPGHEVGMAADRAERPDRRVDAPGDDGRARSNRASDRADQPPSASASSPAK